jgi:DNA repair exonuclease SbcCD ATPase subunit
MTKMPTANEKLERAKKSLKVSQEELQELEEQLATLEGELDGAILDNETKGYKGRRIERLTNQISTLKSRIEMHKKTIHVLETKLPELARDARMETMKGEGIEAYRKVQRKYMEIFNEAPPIEGLSAEISKIQEYIEKLSRIQKEFLAQGKELNAFIIDEKQSAIGEISIESLGSDRGIDFESLKELSSQIITASEALNDLGWKLFGIVTVEYTDSCYLIEDPPKPHIREECECGFHTREYRPDDNMWCLRETRVHPLDKNLSETVVLSRDGGYEKKPAWPCEETD